MAETENRISLQIGKVFIEAWHNVKGLKATILAALFTQVLVMLALISVSIIVNTLAVHFSHDFNETVNIVFSILQDLIGTTLMVGIGLLALMHIRGERVRFFYMFRVFQRKYLLKLWTVAFILMVVHFGLTQASIAFIKHLIPHAAYIVLVLLLIFAFFNYLLVFAFLLIIDKGLKVTSALREVIYSLKQNWGKLIVLFILFLVLVIAFLIPMGVGISYFNQLHDIGMPFTSLSWQVKAKVVLVCVLNLGYLWVMPWLTNVIVITYRNLFAVKTVAMV